MCMVDSTFYEPANVMRRVQTALREGYTPTADMMAATIDWLAECERGRLAKQGWIRRADGSMQEPSRA